MASLLPSPGLGLAERARASSSSSPAAKATVSSSTFSPSTMPTSTLSSAAAAPLQGSKPRRAPRNSGASRRPSSASALSASKSTASPSRLFGATTSSFPHRHSNKRIVSTFGEPLATRSFDADEAAAGSSSPAAAGSESSSSSSALTPPDIERLVAAAAASTAAAVTPENKKAAGGLLAASLPFGLPEELSPLADALAAAAARSADAESVREALEAEAQEVAQLSVDAREAATGARARASEAGAELKAAEAARDAVVAEIDAAIARLDEIAKTMPVPSPDSDAEGEADPADAVRASLAASRSKLVEKEGAVITAREKAEAAAARASAADAAAARADDVAGAAMAAAEAAVRDEMEAAAVAKETSKALAKALSDLQELELSFEGAAAGEAARKKKKVDDAAAAASKDAASTTSSVDSIPSSVTAAVASSASAVVEKAAAAATEVAFSFGAAAEGKGADPASSSALSSSEAAADAATPASPSATPPLSPDSFGESPSSSSSGIQAMKKRLQTRRALAVAALAAVVLACCLTASSVGVADALASALSPAADAARAACSALGSALSAAKAALPPVPHGTEGLIETIWLLATSVVLVPLVSRLPGGSPVLGFLVGGALIGPHALGIIRDVEGVRHLAELGVVFLLFNIGLELSLERLRSMQKFVFGMGSAQVVATLAAIYVAVYAFAASPPGIPGGALSLAGPAAAVVLGGGLALSSTAVAMQVLQDRGESGSRHGRATFAVLLLQDLAVVVLLMLIPLLAPGNGGSGGGAAIARALGLAAVKAVACILTIMAGGRAIVRPFYRLIADTGNADVFAATTLLVVLGTSVLTQLAGLSLALGAFLAGLLLAETEFALQVESDIAPYKGLLMGLFFMTVGMEISVGLFFARMRVVVGGIALLLAGKAAVMAAVGPLFGLSRLVAARAGLLLASGGEFAFVAFGEAQAAGILPASVVQELFLVVALTMALTPLLAELGSRAGKAFGSTSDMKALAPSEGESSALRGHVIIAGFGRVGQIIAQLLAERMIPFVAVDVRVDRVQSGKDLDLPVYFGDAGSAAVLHSLGAERAACAVITLDTPGANYRSVWALNKHFPHVRTYVRAHDVDHGLNLEKAGATAVVPETLEPSLQLASAVLSELSMPPEEVLAAIAAFRKSHLAELQALSKIAEAGSGKKERFSLGYGYTVDDDDEFEGAAAAAAAEGGGGGGGDGGGGVGGMPSPVPA